jgi:sugar phosphate isomerase/epimerase
MQGPAIFLAQFFRDQPPFDRLDTISAWAAGLGYVGVQIPSWDGRALDLDQAAASRAYADDYRRKLGDAGLRITEVAAHLQGQVLAMHPVYQELFQPFYPRGLADSQRREWAAEQLRKAIRAAVNLELSTIPVLSGGFAWHLVYPWPQRPAGLITTAFQELAARWRPLLDRAQEAGVTFAFELHPGSDIYDGATFEMFLEATGQHAAVGINYDPSHFLLQQLDYLDFIDRYGQWIRAFHVKDAEFRPTGRVGVYGGYQDWAHRAGRFRSLGDGQIDFKRIFSLLSQAGFDGWAVLEWECCLKSPEQGAAEGAPFIARHMIEATQVAFDDFAAAETDEQRNRRILGLS